MPKYIPTNEDLWTEEPTCAVCGDSILDYHSDQVCSFMCDMALDEMYAAMGWCDENGNRTEL